MFATVSVQLSAHGVHHTAKQCHQKIMKMKQDYNRIKDHNNQSRADQTAKQVSGTCLIDQLVDQGLGCRASGNNYLQHRQLHFSSLSYCNTLLNLSTALKLLRVIVFFVLFFL